MEVWISFYKPGIDHGFYSQTNSDSIRREKFSIEPLDSTEVGGTSTFLGLTIDQLAEAVQSRHGQGAIITDVEAASES